MEEAPKPGENATLTEVVRNNNPNHALYLLFAGAEVNATDEDGNTPLHLAVKVDCVLMVKAFIVFDADVNKTNSAGFTPLHLAATSEGEDSDVILHMLHICEAQRCAEGPEKQCKDGCSFSGNYNGKPEEICDETDFTAHIDDIAFANGGPGNGNRVLCLDGGGVRGLILIQVLSELEKCAGKPVTQLFDFIGGTSTGGILALGIGVGKTLPYMRRLYFQLKDKVFSGSLAKNSAIIEELLQDEFGDQRMADIKNPKIVVTGTTVDKFPPKLHLFRSYQVSNNMLTTNKSPEDQLIWEAARCTSAAPTFFSHYEQYIDGGLIANNPTLDVLTEIYNNNKTPKEIQSKPYTLSAIWDYVKYLIPSTDRLWSTLSNKRSDSIPHCVVSLGCGRAPAISVDYSDVTIVPQEAPDDVGKFIAGLLAKTPNIKKEIAGAKCLVSVIVNQATTAEGSHVDRARAWCQSLDVPFSRFNPHLSKDISLGCTDNKILIQMMWETNCYIIKNRPRLQRVADLLLNKK